jgi:hypothetical protein
LFTDDDFMELSANAKVLLIGLWTEAADDGVFAWKANGIKARILPAENCDPSALLDELVANGFIKSFDHNGKLYGAVRNFRKFQRPKKPNSSDALPDELRTYVGLDPSSSPPVPNQSPTPSENAPQMEDGGDEMEDEGGGVGEEGSTQAHEASPQDAFDFFVDAVKGRNVHTPHQLSKDRRTKIAARLSESGFEKWQLACAKVAASDFCNGQNDRGWIANLDFLLHPSSFNKLIEGAYDNRAPQGTGPPKRGHSFEDIAAAMHNPPKAMTQ